MLNRDTTEKYDNLMQEETEVAFSSWHSGLARSDFIVFLSALSNLLTGKSDSFSQPNIFFFLLFCHFQPGDSMTGCKHNNCNYGYCTRLTDAEKLTNMSLSVF